MSRNDDLPPDLRKFISIKEHKARDVQARRKKAAPMPGVDDPRPIVQVEAGKIGSIVDAVEAALIAKGGLYQSGNRIVAIGRVPLRTHDNIVVTASRIMEVGDEGLAEAVALAAVMTRFDVRANALVAIDVPTRVVRTLRDRKGRYRFPVLAGIVNSPTLRADGTILDREGFDEATGLYVDFAGETFPKIRPKLERVQVQSGAFWTANGNNLVIAGDMNRRAIVASLEGEG